MTRTELCGKVFNSLASEAQGLLEGKGGEYAADADAFDNFTQAASQLGVSREFVCMVYAQKHWSSIGSFVREIQKGERTIGELEKQLSEPIRGRVLDLINYLVLLYGLIVDRRLDEGGSVDREVGDTSNPDTDIASGFTSADLLRE